MRLVAHQQRRRDLGIAVLAGLQIEHELAKRALEPGQLALQDDEARTGQLGRGLEIHQAQRLADLEMLLRREVERRRLAMAADFAIVVGIGAVRHVVERQIGDDGQRRR